MAAWIRRIPRTAEHQVQGAGLQGADDPFVPAKDLAAFEDEMRQAKVDWQLVKYGARYTVSRSRMPVTTRHEERLTTKRRTVGRGRR